MELKSDAASGVKAFSIIGHLADTKSRCRGMTEEERRWRAQYLKDQVLDHGEPRYVKEFYRSTTNIFRRLWCTPMNNLEAMLSSYLGPVPGYYVRHTIGKGGLMLAFAYIFTYYVKYHSNDFTRAKTLQFYRSRPRMFPGEEGFPKHKKKTPMEYVDEGFLASPLAVKVK